MKSNPPQKSRKGQTYYQAVDKLGEKAHTAAQEEHCECSPIDDENIECEVEPDNEKENKKHRKPKTPKKDPFPFEPEDTFPPEIPPKFPKIPKFFPGNRPML